MALVAFLFVGMLVVVVGLWLRSSTGDDRVRDLAIVAGDMRFKLAERDTHSIEKMPFSLFRMGTSQSAQNVMSGTRDGLAITMFDYQYRIPLHSSDYRYFTCAFITIPAACPWLRLTHENAATRLGDHLGMPDVELEYDEFNRRFRVNCEQKFAFQMLDGQMMEWLLGADHFERVEVIGPWVMIARGKLRPDDWRDLPDWLSGFHAHIPPAVYASYPPR
jgi:hypothetical protein